MKLYEEGLDDAAKAIEGEEEDVLLSCRGGC
jgi:hypothetical protein